MESLDDDIYVGTVNLSWDAPVLAVITGVTVTIDGVVYDSSNTSAENPAIITPDTQSIVFTVTVTNIANLSEKNRVWYAPGCAEAVIEVNGWIIDESTNTASYDFGERLSEFKTAVSAFEVELSDDGGSTWTGTGVYVQYCTHENLSDWKYLNDERHIRHCPDCNRTIEVGEHYGGTATCSEQAVCEGCGEHYGELSSEHSGEWTEWAPYDETQHYRTCKDCGEAMEFGTHSYTDDADYLCDICNAERLVITKQPEGVEAYIGEEVVLTVEAHGEGLTYEWYYIDSNGDSWMFSGCTEATYSMTMTEACHERAVYCVITDKYGEMAASDTVMLTRLARELAIVTQPTDASAKLGENYCVEVLAQGDGLTYEWYFKNAGTNVWHKSGVTDNTYDDVMTKARAGREVYCVVTDIWGNSVTTETATLICP